MPTAVAAAVVWAAVVVVSAAAFERPAAAQVGFSMDAQCTSAEGGFGLQFDWTSREPGSGVTFEVRYANPDMAAGLLYRAAALNAAQHSLVLFRAILRDGATVTWTWTDTLGTRSSATGSLLCEVPPPPPATLDDVEATLTEVHDELVIVDARLTNVNRNVQTVATNTARIDATLTETLGVLAPALEGVRAVNAAQLARAEQDAVTLASINWRLRETDARTNQLRHQTHALLVVVAVMFALWLRPIFRSRKQAT